MAANTKDTRESGSPRPERKPNRDIVQMMRGSASSLLRDKPPSEEDEEFAEELINQCRNTPLKS